MNVIYLPMAGCSVPAGFPSPADDFMEEDVDLLNLLIEKPSATFLARLEGDSMVDVGAFSGDIMIVERHIIPKDGSIVIAALDGQLTCKILDTKRNQLVPANGSMKPIPIGEDADLIIEGTVRRWVRCHVRLG